MNAPTHNTAESTNMRARVMQLADDSAVNDLIAANRDAKTLGQLLSLLVSLLFSFSLLFPHPSIFLNFFLL